MSNVKIIMNPTNWAFDMNDLSPVNFLNVYEDAKKLISEINYKIRPFRNKLDQSLKLCGSEFCYNALCIVLICTLIGIIPLVLYECWYIPKSKKKQEAFMFQEIENAIYTYKDILKGIQVTINKSEESQNKYIGYYLQFTFAPEKQTDSLNYENTCDMFCEPQKKIVNFNNGNILNDIENNKNKNKIIINNKNIYHPIVNIIDKKTKIVLLN